MGYVVIATPRPVYPGNNLVFIIWKVGRVPGPVLTGLENLAPTEIPTRDHSTRSKSLYLLRYTCLPLKKKTLQYIEISVTIVKRNAIQQNKFILGDINIDMIMNFHCWFVPSRATHLIEDAVITPALIHVSWIWISSNLLWRWLKLIYSGTRRDNVKNLIVHDICNIWRHATFSYSTKWKPLWKVTTFQTLLRYKNHPKGHSKRWGLSNVRNNTNMDSLSVPLRHEQFVSVIACQRKVKIRWPARG